MPFWGGLFLERLFGFLEGNLRFKIDWARPIVESKFTAFALFYLVFEGSFSKYKPPGGLYLEGLIHGGAYFRNFTGICPQRA